MMNSFFKTLTVLSITWVCCLRVATSFMLRETTNKNPTTTRNVLKRNLPEKKFSLYATQDIGRPPTFLDEENNKDDDDDEEYDTEGLTISWLDEEDEDEEYDDDDDDDATTGEKKMSPGRQRWENLNPKIKQRLIEKGQAKAIANKKKREPKLDKKRRKFF